MKVKTNGYFDKTSGSIYDEPQRGQKWDFTKKANQDKKDAHCHYGDLIEGYLSLTSMLSSGHDWLNRISEYKNDFDS